MCKLTHLDTQERRDLAQNNFKRIFQELSWIEYDMRNIITNNKYIMKSIYISSLKLKTSLNQLSRMYQKNINLF